jgi:hypothetical protein
MAGFLLLQEDARLATRYCLPLCAAAEALNRMAAAAPQQALVLAASPSVPPAVKKPALAWANDAEYAALQLGSLAGMASRPPAPRAGAHPAAAMEAAAAPAQLQAFCRLAASSLKAAQLQLPSWHASPAAAQPDALWQPAAARHAAALTPLVGPP